MKFLFPSLKTLTNSKSCSRKPHQISVQAFLCSHWSIFSSEYSKPAFGTIFRITGGFRNNFWRHKRQWCGVAHCGAAWLIMVRRGSVGSTSACCKSSILGSARLGSGSVSHWADKRWRNGERPQQMTMDKCIVWMWMWLSECMNVIQNMKNKQKEWHPATKPLTNGYQKAGTSSLKRITAWKEFHN